MIKFIVLVNRMRKVRLNRWYSLETEPKERERLLQQSIDAVLDRPSSHSSVFPLNASTRLVYKKYASLFFIFAIDHDTNELLILDAIHRLVEVLDISFENVCELDLVFNYERLNYVLNEFILAGELLEVDRQSISNALQVFAAK